MREENKNIIEGEKETFENKMQGELKKNSSNKDASFFKMKNIRLFFFLSIVILTYCIFLWKLFRAKQLLFSAGAFCLLFIELIFLSIDLRNLKKRYLWSVLLIVGLIIRIFIPTPIRQLVLTLWISLFAIGFLIPFLGSYFDNVREINWIIYFTSGGYIFTIIAAVLFGFAILGINNRFPFSCEQISGRNEKIIQTSTSPFGLATNHIKDQEIDVTDHNSLVSDLWKKTKTNFLDGVVSTQKSINNKVCEAVIGQIEKIYQNPLFQVGTIFAMYLLFYGVIRLFVWIITIIGYIIFRLIKALGMYKTYKVEKKVEEIV